MLFTRLPPHENAIGAIPTQDKMLNILGEMEDNSMSTELIFRIAFWVLFGGLIVMQAYFASRVQQAGERVTADRRAIAREGWGYVVARIAGSLALIAFLVVYAINPSWIEELTVPFPDWLRWIGIALGCVSFGLYAWAQATLGKEWSPHLQIREKHRLVTTGPYARMRHPIYLAYIAFMICMALITANWFFVALIVISIVVFALRIPKEEHMLIETFGDEYKAYMQRTGGLLPK